MEHLPESAADLVRSDERRRLLTAVTEITPVLRAGALASEQARRLAPEPMRALRESGLMAALAPVEVGGCQVDPLTEMELAQALSAVDGAAGWTWMIAAGSTARIASALPDAAVPEVFPPGGDMPVIAFQEHAFGNRVHPAPGGLRVSGRWPFASGVWHADWVVAAGETDTADISGPEAGPAPGAQMLAAAVPASQIRVDDCWNPGGLAGSGSAAYVIEDVLVPWARVWAYPPSQPLRGGAHFCFRRAPVKHIGFGLGVARAALDAALVHLSSRAGEGRGVHGAVAAELGRTELALNAARAGAVEVISAVWREACERGEVAETSQRRLRAAAVYVTETAVEVCVLAARHAGASALGRNHPVQRALRDMHAGAAHAEVSAGALADFGADLPSASASR